MSENLREAADDGAVLRSIAKSIRPAFPNAADLLLGIERMHWPSEAHRLNAENAHLRPELDRLRAEVEASDERNVRLARRISELHDERNEDVTDLRARLAKVDQEGYTLQSLISRYTRAPGVNGDRVADLLSQDAYEIGTRLRALASVPEPSDSEPAPDADREAGER